MKFEKSLDLFKYNTMRLHSVADSVYFPETSGELEELIKDLKRRGTPFYVFAGGSNIIFAERVTTPLICLMDVDRTITHMGNGLVKVGCSVRVQTLIRDLQKHGLGGIEYLFSVPSSVGGAVYMNAGRGKKMGLSISDYIEKVEYYSPKEMRWGIYENKLGDFSYRRSPFQGTDSIITSVVFHFKEQLAEVTEDLIKARIAYSKKHLSADKPSCGSVFCEGNRFVYRLLMGMKNGDAIYSKKTPDWISNTGNATASDVMALIRKGEKIHRWIGSRCRAEIRYFE